MPLLVWIVLATALGGLLSVAAAALFVLQARANRLPMLISYAIGALLGAAFLEILPHALELSASPERVMGTVLAGILAFFALEKLMLWRHSHGEGLPGPAATHEHSDHRRVATMVIVGDTFHNFVDGVITAGAFLVSVELGIVTALAIIAHEVPQEVGDFLVLLHSGYSRRAAFAYNLLSGLAMVAGGMLAYYSLQTLREWIAPLLGIAAASMIYVSVADLIPGLHDQPDLAATVQQSLLIAAGVATVGAVSAIAHAVIGG